MLCVELAEPLLTVGRGLSAPAPSVKGSLCWLLSPERAQGLLAGLAVPGLDSRGR